MKLTWDGEENEKPITKEKSAPLGIIRPGRSRKEGMAMYVRKTVDLRSMQEKEPWNNSAAQENNKKKKGLPVPLSASLNFVFTGRTLVCRVHRQCAASMCSDACPNTPS